VDRALACSSPLSAPSPDMTPNSVWKCINTVSPNIILNLLSPLPAHGFDPPSLKRAKGIVLDKSGKPSYDTPSSFCVIALLQIFSKILHRFMNAPLGCVARITGLLNPYQCGSVAGMSVADTCNTLPCQRRTLQMDKTKVCTLFLDIKVGVDNFSPSSVCGMLSPKGVHPYLVSWARLFLTGASCCLLFQASPKVFFPVLVGTPQGSPVSPLVCGIYFSRLHRVMPYGITLSYVDDFTLTALSPCYHRNLQILQGQYDILKPIASVGEGVSQSPKPS